LGLGFKAGGFKNTRSQATVNAAYNNGAPGTINTGVVINDNYRKERSSAFEAGIEGSLFGGRINYDLAGYYTRIRDMQFFESLVGSFGLLRVVSNIDRVDVKGAELHFDARIIRGWKVFGAFNLTDGEVKQNA